jgi:hypothetical protein
VIGAPSTMLLALPIAVWLNCEQLFGRTWELFVVRTVANSCRTESVDKDLC